MSTVPAEAGREHPVPWSWNYRGLSYLVWALAIELGFSWKNSK